MSTDFVSRVLGFPDPVPEWLLPVAVPTLSRELCELSSAMVSSSLTSPRKISGALHPNVPTPITPPVVGKKLVWSSSSFRQSPKSDINIRCPFDSPFFALETRMF